MSDKPSREAERAALHDTFADTGTDSVSEPTIPIADKGEVARARHSDEDGSLIDDMARTPRPRSDRAEELASADGLIDPQPELAPLDFEQGTLPTQAITQGDSVLEAAFADRGPASHLDPSGMGRLVEPSAAEVLDRVAGEPLDEALPGDEPVAYQDEEEN